MLNVTIESSTEKKRNTGKEHRALYTELLEANQSAQYWLWDTAEEFETKKNRIYYYPNAGKLVVRLPMYRNKLGALTSLDLKALKETPATLGRLIQILMDLKIQSEQDGNK